ncbi:MAG: Gldg family protein, partial [Verrucomicrobiota bacterium]|nr:Gldg family protein [Verrucomicrobiota bacterium]
DSDGHSKVVNATDMADYDSTEAMYGQPPRVTAFKGEQAVTSALLEVSEAKQSKIYVLNGHGEPELKSETLSGLKAYIERQNLKLDALNLMDVDKIPDDANAIVIIGPKYDFTEREMKLFQDYWAKNGRVFIALDPAAATARLLAFLNDQGVKPEDDRILRTVNLGPVTGILRDVTTDFVEGSPITKRLKDVNGVFLGATQSLALDPARVTPANIKLQPLIQAGQGFWGETAYNIGEGDTIFFDPQKDRAAPLTLAVSVEKGALSDARVKVGSSRMIVVGNSTFVTNEALTEANVDLVLGSLNWLIDREELIGITPKEAKTFTLNLTQAQVGNIALLSMAIIPSFAAALGVASWWQRRR